MARPVAPSDLLTIPEAADIAKVGRATVYRWIAAGLIERVDIGVVKPKTRIRRSSLDAFFNRHTIPGRKVA